MKVLSFLLQSLRALVRDFGVYPKSYLFLFAFVAFFGVLMAVRQWRDTAGLPARYRVLFLIPTILTLIGYFGVGTMLTLANETAELDPLRYGKGIFTELAVCGLLMTGLYVLSIYRSDSSDMSEEGVELAKSQAKGLLMGVFLIVMSVIFRLTGLAQSLPSWGFTLFGKTLGGWIYGAYLACGVWAVFSIAASVFQIPAQIWLGNMEDRMYDSLDQIDEMIDHNKQTKSAAPAASTAKSAAPAAKPAASAVKTAAKPAAPAVKTAAKPAAPAAKPAAAAAKPVARPGAPSVKTAAKPAAPTAKPVTPTAKPAASAAKTAAKPAAPAARPAAPTAKPAAPNRYFHKTYTKESNVAQTIRSDHRQQAVLEAWSELKKPEHTNEERLRWLQEKDPELKIRNKVALLQCGEIVVISKDGRVSW